MELVDLSGYIGEATGNNQRYISHFSTDPIHSVYNGTESESYLGPKIWDQIPAEIKNKDFLEGFKREIKKWTYAEYPRRICKTFVPNLGFVW